MEDYQVLGSLAKTLHSEFRTQFYLLLPVFFALSLLFAWFRNPAGGPDFLESLKRTLVASLLLVAFQEISQSILFIANGISDRISDMSGLDSVFQMASQKASSYTLSFNSVIFGINDFLIATISFLSWLLLYVCRYLMVAVYHFSWSFLTIISPFLILLNILSPSITLNLFKSMAEIASWQIVWSVLSAMLKALPFGQAYAVDGNYLTIIILNVVIALCMLLTPLVVRALVGNAFSAFAGSLGPMAATALFAAPTKAATLTTFGRSVLSNSTRFAIDKTAGIAATSPLRRDTLDASMGSAIPPKKGKSSTYSAARSNASLDKSDTPNNETK